MQGCERRSRSGTGFAAVFGIAASGASLAIYEAAAAPGLSAVHGGRRVALELTSGTRSGFGFSFGLGLPMDLFVAAAAIAAAAAVVGLALGHHLARSKVAPLAAVTTAAGTGFALANILPQDKFLGFSFGNVLGAGVHGWSILWGILFLVLAASPPLLGLFMPRSEALLAMWYGWLTFALAWQISGLPSSGASAAPGLYVTWILWLIALTGTIAMIGRLQAGKAGVPTPG